MSEQVILTQSEGVARIVVARPEKLNALSANMIAELESHVSALETAGSRFLIVTGAGEKSFCAGADLAEVVALTPEGVDARNDRVRRLFEDISRLPFPSLAVINGLAMGGGLELALACTFRLMHVAAFLSMPEVRLGLMPTYGGTQRLPALVGESRALSMLLSGRKVQAAEALSMGLVNAVYDSDGDAAAKAFIGPFLDCPAGAQRSILNLVHSSAQKPWKERLEMEATVAAEVCRSDAARNGMEGFAARSAKR